MDREKMVEAMFLVENGSSGLGKRTKAFELFLSVLGTLKSFLYTHCPISQVYRFVLSFALLGLFAPLPRSVFRFALSLALSLLPLGLSEESDLLLSL